MERGVAIVVCRVDQSPTAYQQRDQPLLVVERGDREWSLPVLAVDVHRGAGGEQQHRDPLKAVLARMNERRVSLVVHLVDVCLAGEQQLDDALAALGGLCARHGGSEQRANTVTLRCELGVWVAAVEKVRAHSHLVALDDCPDGHLHALPEDCPALGETKRRQVVAVHLAGGVNGRRAPEVGERVQVRLDEALEEIIRGHAVRQLLVVPDAIHHVAHANLPWEQICCSLRAQILLDDVAAELDDLGEQVLEHARQVDRRLRVPQPARPAHDRSTDPRRPYRQLVPPVSLLTHPSYHLVHRGRRLARLGDGVVGELAREKGSDRFLDRRDARRDGREPVRQRVDQIATHVRVQVVEERAHRVTRRRRRHTIVAQAEPAHRDGHDDAREHLVQDQAHQLHRAALHTVLRVHLPQHRQNVRASPAQQPTGPDRTAAKVGRVERRRVTVLRTPAQLLHEPLVLAHVQLDMQGQHCRRRRRRGGRLLPEA